MFNQKAIDFNEQVYSARDSQESRVFYDERASEYDEIAAATRFWDPVIQASLVTRYSGGDFDISVLDVACGTGAVGDILVNQAGFANVDGIDNSPEMLAQAREKGVYKTLKVADLNGGKLDNIPDATYDLWVASGAFASGHVTGAALPELVRILKPGGYATFTVFDMAGVQPDGFPDALDALVAQGSLKQREAFTTCSTPMGAEDLVCHVHVLECA